MAVALVAALGVPGVRAIAAVWGQGTAVLELARRITAEQPLEGVRVASDGARSQTMLVCLHAGCRYYG